LALDLQHLFLGHALEGAVLRHPLDGAQPLDRALDRAKIGEGSTQPAIGYEELTAPFGLFLNDLLRLLLGAHEQHAVATANRVDQEAVGTTEQPHSMLQINDMDAVTRPEDVRPHLRVPAFGLVPKVYASLQKLAHRDRGILRLLLSFHPILRFSSAGFIGQW